MQKAKFEASGGVLSNRQDVYITLRKFITDDLAMEYSGLGQKEKLSFSDTEFYKMLAGKFLILTVVSVK